MDDIAENVGNTDQREIHSVPPPLPGVSLFFKFAWVCSILIKTRRVNVHRISGPLNDHGCDSIEKIATAVRPANGKRALSHNNGA